MALFGGSKGNEDAGKEARRRADEHRTRSQERQWHPTDGREEAEREDEAFREGRRRQWVDPADSTDDD
jgi:hypothetical protein